MSDVDDLKERIRELEERNRKLEAGNKHLIEVVNGFIAKSNLPKPKPDLRNRNFMIKLNYERLLKDLKQYKKNHYLNGTPANVAIMMLAHEYGLEVETIRSIIRRRAKKVYS